MKRVPSQVSFAQAEYAKKKKQTRREIFLGKMEQVVPWVRLTEVIEPHYPKGGGRGRPPIGLEKMLRMYFVQQWYGLADEAVEDAIYDSQALRNFMGIDLSQQSVPDATTLMGFRHLLEANDLTQAMLIEVNAMLIERGLLMSKGTLVDATLIAAPTSTKNKEHGRDPEMHQTKKGNEWHFGMKAHIGVDKDSGLVHTVVTTAANVSDISQTPVMLHGQEEQVWLDAGYVGVDKREDMQEALKANGQEALGWHIAKRRKTIKKMAEGWQKSLAQAYERAKARVRARVEHPFHVIKNIFKYKKARFKGLAKNDSQLQALFALSNLYMARAELRP
jgi:transposase, IS5 family